MPYVIYHVPVGLVASSPDLNLIRNDTNLPRAGVLALMVKPKLDSAVVIVDGC